MKYIDCEKHMKNIIENCEVFEFIIHKDFTGNLELFKNHGA